MANPQDQLKQIEASLKLTGAINQLNGLEKQKVAADLKLEYFSKLVDIVNEDITSGQLKENDSTMQLYCQEELTKLTGVVKTLSEKIDTHKKLIEKIKEQQKI